MKNNSIFLSFLSISTPSLRSSALIRDSQDETNNDVNTVDHNGDNADNLNTEQNNKYDAGFSEISCNDDKIDNSCSLTKGREKKKSIPCACVHVCVRVCASLFVTYLNRMVASL
jgi:hypothetical protein